MTAILVCRLYNNREVIRKNFDELKNETVLKAVYAQSDNCSRQDICIFYIVDNTVKYAEYFYRKYA